MQKEINRSHTSILMVALLALVLSLASCSAFTSYKSETPEAKIAVLSVARNYLGFIVMGNYNQVFGLILWNSFLDSSDSAFTKEDVRKQMELIQNRWSKEEHPLLNLDMKDIEVRADTAELTLQKFNSPDSPKIVINFIWTGSGWLIQKDNIFGSDGVLAKALTPPKDSNFPN